MWLIAKRKKTYTCTMGEHSCIVSMHCHFLTFDLSACERCSSLATMRNLTRRLCYRIRSLAQRSERICPELSPQCVYSTLAPSQTRTISHPSHSSKKEPGRPLTLPAGVQRSSSLCAYSSCVAWLGRGVLLLDVLFAEREQ